MKLWKISCKIGRYQIIHPIHLTWSLKKQFWNFFEIEVLLHKMFDPILFYLTPKKLNTKLVLKPRPFKILPAFQSTPVCEDNFNLLQFIFNWSKNIRPVENQNCDIMYWGSKFSSHWPCQAWDWKARKMLIFRATEGQLL